MNINSKYNSSLNSNQSYNYREVIERYLKKWYWYVADFGIMFAAKSVGFAASYDLIFK